MFEDLLTPISDEAPCGEYLKDNRSLFRGYRNEFNMAQSSFRQLMEIPDALEDAELVEANFANWQKLSDTCYQCLKENSKDLEIFSWFTVAQLFGPEPFQNLSSSLKTMESVVEKYWDTLNPVLPEKKRKGDTEQQQAVEVAEHRIKPLLQLIGDTAESGLLYMPLQMLALVGDIDYGRFYKNEKDGTLATLKAEAVSALASERGEVEARILALGESLEALTQLETLISSKCGDVGAQALSFRFVKESIERLISALRYLVGEQFTHWPLDPVVETPAEPEPVEVTPTVDPAVADAVAESPITPAVSPVSAAAPAALSSPAIATMATASAAATREQALADLQVIADYFLENEPHSPIYLLLKRAIRWGGMSLPELLEELVGDNNAVHQRIEHLAGLESAEHKAELKATAVPQPQVVMPPETVQEEVKAQESTSTPSSDSGLSNIEW
ncbi:ImpA family type VI secretion system protein [Vibrio fortis]|uniref:type VI secretion system protein TssA n=1 Tax=Vibrio fortis TaxID=212667 RepID=UPI0038CD154F